MLKQAYKTKVRTHYENLHKIPETGFDLYKTKQYVKNALNELGYAVKESGRCGLYTEIGSGEKIFLIRADMDALPFSNRNIHACGHDMHTAMLLGAAELLKASESKLKTKIRLMFQPAEEILEGAKDMIDSGILDGVNAAMMLHVMPNVPFKTGTVAIPSNGVSAPSADFFTITVKGQGCHGSSPWNGRDPITCAAHILLILQDIAYKEMSTDTILTVGAFNSGTAANVIPDTAILKGSCRCYDEKERNKLKIRIKSVCKNISEACETDADVIFDSGCPTLINDAVVRDNVKKQVTDLLGKNSLIEPSEISKTAGSEDFAYISQKVPSVMLALAAGNSEDGYCHPLHHPDVKFDTEVLPYGCAILAYTAMHYFE